MDRFACRWLAVAAALTVASPASALPACHATSGANVRPLVELYTSEGCDSCPPADRWLTAHFPAAAAGDAQPLALAFHVDYWDRLGWSDRFANAAYTERQYAAMRANGATFVFTPQVLLQGHDLRWQDRTATAALETAARTRARASLTVDATVSDASIAVRVGADLADRTPSGDVQVFVAYADSGLVSDVKAGENRGKRLAHDHVVRALKSFDAPQGVVHIDATFDVGRPREAGSAPTLVVFAQRRSTGDVLQSLAMPLDGCRAP